jgi:hypothetical protein
LCRCCFILERDPCTLLPLCCISRLVPPLHMISVLPFFWKELVYGFGGSCLLLAAGLERSMCFSCFNYTRTACLGLERTCVGCLALGRSTCMERICIGAFSCCPSRVFGMLYFLVLQTFLMETRLLYLRASENKHAT